MKTKSILFLVFVLFSFSTHGKESALLLRTNANSPASAPATDGDKTPFDYSKVKITQSEIFTAIDDIYNRMKKESADKPLYPTQFGGFAGVIDFYCKYPKIERETGVSKSWFEKLQKVLLKMVPFRTNMKIAKMNQDNKFYVENKAEYNKLFIEFEKLYKNPEKVKK
ncbi:MAG: hypothetical protein WAX69_13720 [Victivallales bacterium]